MSRRRWAMSSLRGRADMTARKAVISRSLISLSPWAPSPWAPSPLRICFAALWRGLVLLAQLCHRDLQEAGKVEHRGVLLVPADIAAAVFRPPLVPRAAPVVAEELAGAKAGLDALAAFAGAFDD